MHYAFQHRVFFAALAVAIPASSPCKRTQLFIPLKSVKMDLRPFKLNLAALFTKQAGSHPIDSLPPSTDKREKGRYTPVPQRPLGDTKQAARPQSAARNTHPLRLLLLDSRVEDTQPHEEQAKGLSNEELYGRESIMKQRNVSNLEQLVDRKPMLDEFKRQASAIQKEIKLIGSALKTDRSEDRLTTARRGWADQSSAESFRPQRDTIDANPRSREREFMQKIERYEQELRTKDEEIAGLQKQVQARTASIRTLEKELSQNESRASLYQIYEALNVTSPTQAISAVRRLETAVRNSVRLEKLLAEISATVCPDKLETSPEAVLLSLKRWEAEIASVRSAKAEDAEALQHIRQVFDFKEGEDVLEAANRVFLQVHELRNFTKHLKQQLGLSEDCSLSSVLLFVKQILRRVQS